MGNSQRSNSTNLGRIIYNSNYDKQPISDSAADSIDLKNATNLCLSEDGYYTACEGWKNLIKVKTTVPYTFGIDSQIIWDHIKKKQPFEYDMALHFGLQFDLRTIEKETPGLIYTEYFHSLMYLRFASYIREVASTNARKAVMELSKDTFSVRLAAYRKDVKKLIKLEPAISGFFDKATYIGMAEGIIVNRGPFYIDQVLYYTIFGQNKRWNRQAYNLARSEYGYQRPLSEMTKMGEDF